MGIMVFIPYYGQCGISIINRTIPVSDARILLPGLGFCWSWPKDTREPRSSAKDDAVFCCFGGLDLEHGLVNFSW